MVQVKELRLSLIWIAIDTLFLDPQATAPLNGLGRLDTYSTVFEQLPHEPWHRPWVGGSGRGFWQRHLERSWLWSVDGRRAWRAQVPLATGVKVRAVASNPFRRLQIDGYAYPTGLAVVVTGRARYSDVEPASLEQVVGAAQRLRLGDEAIAVDTDAERHGVEFVGSSGSELKIFELADTVRQSVSAAAFGDPEHGTSWADPFSIATVVSASRETEGSPTEKEHRALEGLLTWSRAWEHADLRRLDQLVTVGEATSANVVLADPWSRAIWFPKFFTWHSGRSLGCYHRNQVCATTQTLLLSQLLYETPSFENLAPRHDECVKRAAELLGRIYRGDRSAYQSRSLARVIDDLGYRKKLDEARSKYGFSPLG